MTASHSSSRRCRDTRVAPHQSTLRWQTSFAARIVLALTIFVALPRHAQGESADPKTAARAKALEGSRIADEGQHERALALFRQAFTLFPEPAYLYDIGVECQALGRDVEALDAYARFLRDPHNTPLSLVTHARELTAELDKRLGEIQVRGAPDGANIDVDGEPRGTAPVSEPVRAKPGSHRVVVRRPGFEPFRTDVLVPEGAAVIVDVVPLTPLELPIATVAPEQKPWLSWDAALGAGFWTAGPPSNTGPSPTFAIGAGHVLASLPSEFDVQAGVKIGFTYLSEPGATDTFVSIVANPRLQKKLSDRVRAFADLGIGLLVLSGVPDQSFLLVESGGRVTGALVTFELRPALGVNVALSDTFSLIGGPSFVWNPSPSDRFQSSSLTRVELTLGVRGDL